MGILDLPPQPDSNHKKDTIVMQAGFDQIVAVRNKEAMVPHSGQSTLRMSHALQSHKVSQSRAQSGQKR